MGWWVGECVDGWVFWVDEWVDGWVGGWTSGQVGGQVGGLVDESTEDLMEWNGLLDGRFDC